METKAKPKKTSAVSLKNKHTDDLVDHYWASISYLQDLIKSSELKAGLILSFYGILLNFLYQSKDGLALMELNEFIKVLFIVWVVVTLASIYFCVRCFMPKIEGQYDHNMFFFKDIISRFGDIKNFSRHFFEASCDENKLFEQLGEQIFIISKIADWKFRNVKRAISLLAIGLSIILVLGGISFIGNFI
jgi:hypothetical protein